METAAGGGLNNQGMRLGRIGAGLALLMLGSVAVGCGDGMPAPQAQGEVAGPVAKPRVAAFAREVQLRAGDLPGSTAAPTTSDDAGDEFGAWFARCTGSGLNPPVVAEFLTPSFYYAKRGESAGFLTQLRAAPTPSEAKALISLIRSPQGFKCMQHLIPRVFEVSTSGVELHVISITRLTTPLPPTRYSYALRIEMTESEGEREARTFADQIGFVTGPVEIVLNAFGSPTPVNQAIEGGLIDALYVRALNTSF